MGTVNRVFDAAGRSIKRSSVWVLEAAKRLFSPSDDDYPKTGVQPFEGDIPETNHQ